MSPLLHKEGSVESAASTLPSSAHSGSPSRAWWPDGTAAATGSSPSHASTGDTAKTIPTAEPVGDTGLQESLQSERAASAAEMATQHEAEAVPRIGSSPHAADAPTMDELAVHKEGIANEHLAGSVSLVLPEQAPARGAQSQSAPAQEPGLSEVRAINQMFPPLTDASTASPAPKSTAPAPSDVSSSGSVSTGLAPSAADVSLQSKPAGLQAEPDLSVSQTPTSAAQQGSSAASDQAPMTLQTRTEMPPSSIQPEPPGDDWLDALRQYSPTPPDSISHPSAKTREQDGRDQQKSTLRDLAADSSPGFQFSFDIPGGSSPETPRASVGPPALAPEMSSSPGSSSRSPGKRRAPDGGSQRSQHQRQAVQLSLRLEHLRLTDGDVGQLADWAEAQGSRAEVVKLWLFDNSISDAGAFHVGRMLHEGMQEVGNVYLVRHCTDFAQIV